MEEDNTGALLERLLKERGMSQRRLALLSGVDRGYINSLIKGRGGSISLRTARKFAEALEIPPEVFLTSEEIRQPRPLSIILSEAQQRYELLETAEIFIRGSVPAGYPFPEEEQMEGYITIPREELGDIKNTNNLYALKVNGDSLSGDGIYSGDLVIVEPDPQIVDGKIYISRLGNECVARHIYRQDNKLKLVSSDGNHAVIEANELEILGRVILSGRWKKH